MKPKINKLPRQIDSFDREEIDFCLNRALARLLKHDKLLFQNDASERSICHRLALYLQCEFPDFHVDCEYNRRYEKPGLSKRLHGAVVVKLGNRRPKIDDKDSITVFPDIIVHRRNTDDNLLVIETKKTSSNVSDDFDREKLKAYHEELGYRFAKFLKFGTERGDRRIDENEFVWPTR